MKKSVVLQVLVAVSAVAYGVFAGRAQASRLRELKQDLSRGNLRGVFIAVVVIAILSALSVRD